MNPTQWTVFGGMMLAVAAMAALPLLAMLLDALARVWPYLVIAFLFLRFCA